MGLGCVNTEPKALAGGPAAPLLMGLGRVNTEPKALAAGTAGYMTCKSMHFRYLVSGAAGRMG